MQQNEYYIIDEGRITGPVTEHFIHMLISSGVLNPWVDKICCPAYSKDWVLVTETMAWTSYRQLYPTAQSGVEQTYGLDWISHHQPKKPDSWEAVMAWMPLISVLAWYMMVFWAKTDIYTPSKWATRTAFSSFDGFWLVLVMNIGASMIDAYRLQTRKQGHPDLWLYTLVPPVYLWKRLSWTGLNVPALATYGFSVIFATVVWFVVSI